MAPVLMGDEMPRRLPPAWIQSLTLRNLPIDDCQTCERQVYRAPASRRIKVDCFMIFVREAQAAALKSTCPCRRSTTDTIAARGNDVAIVAVPGEDGLCPKQICVAGPPGIISHSLQD